MQEVMQVVNTFLSDCCRRIPKGGSHLYEVYHPFFVSQQMYDGRGRFSIVAHRGRVKKWILQDILRAIDALATLRTQEDQAE